MVKGYLPLLCYTLTYQGVSGRSVPEKTDPPSFVLRTNVHVHSRPPSYILEESLAFHREIARFPSWNRES